MEDEKRKEKIDELLKKLEFYKTKLAEEMKGYRGVIHESAVSEIKHDKVMVLRAMVEGIEDELAKLRVES